MQRSHYLLFGALALAACGAQTKNDPRDPQAPALEPAVIASPAPALPTPAAAAASTSPKSTLIPADPHERLIALGQGYSLVTATMINQDIRMLSGLYAPDAQLTLPDTAVRGVPAVALKWAALAKAKSLYDFQRNTKGMRVLDDSTLADSGVYLMILKRTARDSIIERGRYASTWRARAGGYGNWVMLDDRIAPDVAKKRQ